MNFVSTTATKLLCINSARISTPLLAVLRSRYKSLYCQLTEADHANLQGLASDLYRHESGKYRMLKPPDIANLFNENLMSASLLKDFSDIHETTVQYGSPELADQLSGAMYMHAQSVEDKSSIALRVSDELYNLDNEQIQACLEHSCQWPIDTVFQSWTLQKIVQSLDSVCHQRSLQETWNSNDQLFRAVYLMSLNLLKVKEAKFLHYFVFRTNTEKCLKTHDALVFYLLISAFNNLSSNLSDTQLENLINRVESHFDTFEAVELAVSYAGLSALTEKQPISLTKLKKRIESRFGFRLN